MLHGAVRLADHARADVVRHRHRPRPRPCRASSRVFTAADVPGELRVGLIHKDWPVFIPVGGRTSYLGDVLAFVVADDRATARRAAALVEVELPTCCARSPTRSPPSTTPRSRCGAPTATCCQRSAYARGATSTPRSRRAPTSCTRCSRPSASSTPSSSRSRRWPCPGGRRRAAARVLRRPGRVGRPRPDRLGARHRPRPHHRRAGLQRRRVRRQGGHGEPGADRAGRLAAGARR